MDDQWKVLGATLLGAAIGGLAGYLYLTDRGKALRQDLEPGVDQALAEVRRLRTMIGRAKTAAEEGRRALEELRGHGDRTPEWVTSYRANAAF